MRQEAAGHDARGPGAGKHTERLETGAFEMASSEPGSVEGERTKALVHFMPLCVFGPTTKAKFYVEISIQRKHGNATSHVR